MVDLSLERCLEALIGIVLTKKVGLPNEEALTVVVAVDEPAGDVVGLVAADFAGGGIENGQAWVSISLDNNYFGATPETKDPACCRLDRGLIPTFSHGAHSTHDRLRILL